MNTTPSKLTIAIVGSVLLGSLVGVSLLIWESYLALTAAPTKTEILLADPDALPAVTPQIVLLRQHMRGFQANGRELLPLGGVAHQDTVYCREAGDLIRYQSDRYGFRNPDHLWDSAIDMVAIGDSYTQGSCVHDHEHMVGVLRETYPRTLNLGSFGNGPLANLGVLTEYALPARPKTVLWFYVANDMSMDTLLESGSAVLRRYREPGFTQHLQQRQAEIDHHLRPFLQKEIQRQVAEQQAASWWTLDRTRHRLRQLTVQLLRPQAPDLPAESDYDRQQRLDYTDHAIMVATAAERARQIGAEFFFVIIPDARMLRQNVPEPYNPATHVARLETSIQNMGVHTINVYSYMRTQPNPESWYAALDGYYGHFNPAGYRRVAQYIKQELQKYRQTVATSP